MTSTTCDCRRAGARARRAAVRSAKDAAVRSVAMRLPGADDAPSYQALRLHGLREYTTAFTSSAEQEVARPLDWPRRRLAADGARPHDVFLGAFDGATLCGVVGLEGRYRPKESHNAALVGMVVPEQWAGQGIGRMLVEALVQRARTFPRLTQIDLTVTAGNERARRLYEGCGFRLVGVLPRAVRVDGCYHDKLQMQLRLD